MKKERLTEFQKRELEKAEERIKAQELRLDSAWGAVWRIQQDKEAGVYRTKKQLEKYQTQLLAATQRVRMVQAELEELDIFCKALKGKINWKDYDFQD